MQDCNAFSLISVRSMNPRDPVGKCKKRREKLLGSAWIRLHHVGKEAICT